MLGSPPVASISQSTRSRSRGRGAPRWCHGAALLLATVFAAGCASPPVLVATMASDAQLSCPELQVQYSQAQRVWVNARKEKGLSEGNVYRALLFWPALVATQMNASESSAAADKRMQVLADLMQKQQPCAVPEGPMAGAANGPIPFFKGVVLERRDIASTQMMTPVPMPGGGFITVPTGSAAKSILTVRDLRGMTRRLVSSTPFEVGACIEVFGPATLPRGLLDFETGEVSAQAAGGCT